MFEYSKYQKDIFNFIEHENGNLLIEARAGCGKTSTLIKSASLIDSNKKILFCAFNVDISEEIKEKVKDLTNINVKTIHSLGLSILKSNFKDVKMLINDKKYYEEIYKNIQEYTTINPLLLGKKKASCYYGNILQLVNLMRLNMYSTEKQSVEIIDRYNMSIIADEVEVCIKLMKWGKSNIETIDYTDMLWLPNILYLKPKYHKYDFIFVDECQDLSVAQRELIMKCRKINTRYIFCGDSFQSIYGFCSADINSFNKIKSTPNTTIMDLPISYRCADSIVNFAKTIVHSIEKNNDNRQGEVKFNCTLNDVNDGDMIICRNNAPLMKIYNDFLKIGKKCHIRGKDIGENLKTYINMTDKDELNVDLNKDGVFARLYEMIFKLRNTLMLKYNIDEKEACNTEQFKNKLDVIRTLEILSNNINTSEELLHRIEEMFCDENKEGIMLSTIHKSKGLESNNVFIACHSLIGKKEKANEIEHSQENNLKYVAYTRAKNFLGFLDENDFKAIICDDFEPLNKIEYKVNKLLGIKKDVMTIEYAKEISNNVEKISNRPIQNIINGLNKKTNQKILFGLKKC